jgi:hypothetical protein
MRVETYIDEKLVGAVDVKHIDTNPVFEKNFFDIPHLQSVYPAAKHNSDDHKEEDDLEKVQQSIEEFKKRFD